jgi:hypothetical protein
VEKTQTKSPCLIVKSSFLLVVKFQNPLKNFKKKQPGGQSVKVLWISGNNFLRAFILPSTWQVGRENGRKNMGF